MTSVAWPRGMKRQPWQHQYDAYEKLGSLWYRGQPGTALYSGMGTGKSLVAVSLLRAFDFRRTLIISPRSMVEEWPDMLANESLGYFEGLPLLGSLSSRVELLNAHTPRRDPLVFVTTVDAFWRADLGERLASLPWDCIIVDESQRIKGAGSKSSRFAHLLGKRTPYRLAMTGTPLHDKPLDVYGQYRFVDSRIFGTNFAKFKARYAIEEYLGRGISRVVGYQNEPELSEKIYSIAFRVDDSVSDLPPVHYIDRRVRLEDSTMRLYRKLEREFVLDFGEAGTTITPNVLAKLLRLQQITSGYVTVEDAEGTETEKELSTEKRVALGELLEEIDSAKPVVVFARFSRDLANIRSVAEIAGRPYYEQSGNRNQWRDWRAASDNGVIGVQLQAGSAGIDLTRSPYAVFYSHSFSRGDYEQAVKRVSRPGQTETTFVYHLLARDTVDTKIRRALHEKGEISRAILDEYRR